MSSYSADLSNDNSNQVRRIMKTEAYQKIFPGVGIGDKDKEGNWTTTHGGKMFSPGIGGPATGFGAGGMNPYFEGCIIIDDPLKALDARSEAKRQEVINYFTGTLENRRNSPDTPIIIIMQRLHPNDLVGWIQKNKFLGPWEILKLKGIGDDGKALWKERKSREIDPFTFHAQGQQEPIMPGGNLCDREWWHRWTTDSLKEVVGGFITVDSSYGKTKKADYTVFQVWLYSSQGLLLYDQVRGIWKTPEIIERLKRLWEKYKPVAINDLPMGPIYIEDKANGTSIAQDLEINGLPVEYWEPKGVHKVLRFKDSLPGIKGGRTMIPPDDYQANREPFYVGENMKFVPDFVDEHSEFSEDDSHDYDDQCDGQSMADRIYREMYGGMMDG
jgi:predicted phage terminase large subunit-like protein